MSYRATVRDISRFEGVGIHSGLPAILQIEPAASGTGRVFVRRDLGQAEVPVQPSSIEIVRRATGLMANGVHIRTPEHVLSALAATGISDCRIVLDSEEVPILDGSAAPFVAGILAAERVEYAEPWVPIVIQEPIRVCENGTEIEILPYEGTRFDYHLAYPEPLGIQEFSVELTLDEYQSNIAAARTFGFFSEYDQLVKSGLAQGASFDNALVMMTDGSYSTPPRFPNEPVRHKILDMIGDFAILGRPLHARVIGNKSGHALNLAAVLKIFE